MIANLQRLDVDANASATLPGRAAKLRATREAMVDAPPAVRVDPIAEFFERSVQDRYRDWDLCANVAHWASVSAGVALMVVAGLDLF